MKQTKSSKTVVDCYSILDLTRATGVEDLTEGIYDGDPAVPYEEAQRRQINYLLDQVGCVESSRLLDIGCGNGTLLQAAKKRRAKAIGITISPTQVERCREKGLDVRLLNYRNIGSEWTGQFDCIVANGSIEHFVQPQDAVKGRTDKLYQELFSICHRLFDPVSVSKKFATTIIHFNRVPNPKDLLKSPFAFRWDSDQFHYAFVLQKCFGGFYPVASQLEQCAKGLFNLKQEVDGTSDYHLTSEYWLRCLKKGFLKRQFLAGVVSQFFHRPKQSIEMLICLLVCQSWNWQFRTKDPPTRLLRQTWSYID